MHELDALVATTIARTARTFAAQGTGTEAGVAFEHAVYRNLLGAAHWRYNAGPDELEMGGLLQSRTGIRYEFDTVLLAADTLYVVEAKRHAHITRQHISEFVAKLLDVTLGSADQIGAHAIKLVFASGLPQVDAAAWSYAVSWGVLLVTPSRATPWELLAALRSRDTSGAASEAGTVHTLAADCEEAALHLWRPFDTAITLARGRHSHFDLNAEAIYTAQRAAEVLAFWRECERAVETLTGAQHVG